MHEERPSEGGPGLSGRFLLAASAVLLSLAGAFFFLPLLYVAPAPLVALVYLHGYRLGIGTAVFTLVAIGAAHQGAFGPLAAFIDDASWQGLFLTGMTVVLTIGLIGLVIGGAWREGASRWQAQWLGVAAALVPMLTIGLIFWFFRGVDLLQLVFEAWTGLMRGLVDQAVRGGLPDDAAAGLLEMIADTEATFPAAKAMFPGIATVAAVIGVHINGSLAAWMLARSPAPPPPLAPFVAWRFPWPFALLFVLGHALVLTDRFRAGPMVGVVGHNVLLATGFIFAVQGVAILWYVLERRRMAWVLRGAIVLLLLGWWPVVLTWLGVLDTWFHFRAKGPGAGRGGRE